ncbi:MAG: histidinol-phosphate transaminase [Candidatus Neomarinimicrobiota bacterium]
MPLVPKNIKELAPYIPGRPIEQVRRELGLSEISQLASNENPLGPSPMAVEALRRESTQSNRYPESGGNGLRKELAVRFNIKTENVILGAGSESVMATIMRTFLLPEDEIITAADSFLGFTLLARASGKRVHWVPMKDNRYDLESMATHINEYTKIIYLANPDNPMGTYFTVEEFDSFMEKVPARVLIIMDEAYFEFARHLSDYPDSMHYRYDNVITLRTFSKAYGLAGVRIGYGFAHDELISNLMKVKPTFEPSRLALVAGTAALDDTDHLKKTVELTHKGIEFLNESFSQLGIPFVPSAANFVTTRWKSEVRAEEICQKTLKMGVILRHLKPFGWPSRIRVSVGLPHENEKVASALKSFL